MIIKRQNISRFTIYCLRSEAEQIISLRDASALAPTGIWLESGPAESPHTAGVQGFVLCCNSEDRDSIARIEGLVRQ